MAREADLDELAKATLHRIQLEPIEFVGETFEVVVTVLVSQDEPIEEPVRESLAGQLASRANAAIDRRKAEGRSPLGIASARLQYIAEPDFGTALTSGGYRLVLGL